MKEDTRGYSKTGKIPFNWEGHNQEQHEVPFLGTLNKQKYFKKDGSFSLIVVYFAEARSLADGDWPCWTRCVSS